MNKALSFVKLDFFTIKPYIKQFPFLFIAPVALTLNSGGSSGISVFMIFTTIFFTYTFAIGEKSNMDALYPTLAINRRTVVLGRYLFTLVLDIFFGFVSYATVFGILAALQRDFDALEFFIILIVMFVVCSIIQAVQLPIFFKLGYSKGRVLVYIPFAAFAAVPFIITVFFNDIDITAQLSGLADWFAANQIITAVIAAVIWLAAMFISYNISLAGYKKRDF